VDQIDAVLTEVPDQFLVGLVAVLLQDVPCHVRGSLLDPHFALEARAGRGDHPRRQRGVAADLAALLQEGDGQVLVLAGRERRREPAPAGPAISTSVSTSNSTSPAETTSALASSSVRRCGSVSSELIPRGRNHTA